MDNKLINILRKVQKPARYVGGEICMPTIDTETRIRYCLCFPDVYEVGMSNVGTKILYQKGFTDKVTAKICDLFRLHPVLGTMNSKVTVLGVRAGRLENVWRKYIRFHVYKYLIIQLLLVSI